MGEIGTREEYDNIKETKYYDMGKSNCPFCTYDSIEQKEVTAIWRGTKWYIIKNKFPYTNTGGHLMAIPYQHKCLAGDLNIDDFKELKNVHDFVKSYFGDKDYFSFTRETFANRSLEHYHIHFLNGKLQGKFLRDMLKRQGLF